MNPQRPPAKNPSALTLVLCVALLCVIWGSTWIVIKGGLQDLPPFTSAGARFALAAIVMAGVAHLLAKREGGSRPPLRLVLAMGLLNFGLSYGIVYWTETQLPSGLVSVLWGVFPMLMAGFGHLLLPGEQLRTPQWAGFAVGFLGVAVLFQTDLAAAGPDAMVAGGILLLSPAVSSIGTLMVKRDGGGVSSLMLNRDGMFVGAAVLLTVAAIFEHDATVRWTPTAIGSVVYLAVAGTVVTFGLYWWAMRYAPAYQLSLIAYVTPMIALALGAFVGNEPVGWHTVMGTLLVLGGVSGVFLGKRAKGATSNAAPPAETLPESPEASPGQGPA